jgi:23S rRNA pseudouridine2605 synthase
LYRQGFDRAAGFLGYLGLNTMTRERLQKVIAASGLASRRKAEELIAAGEVTVNGQVATLGDSADSETDSITVSGRPVLRPTRHRYVALNKPSGYVTSTRSTHGERTVLELVAVDQRVFPVGRLDKETSGLLLLTDDGEWANRITHPRYQVEKEYVAVVRGVPSPESMVRLSGGIELPSGETTAPAKVRLIGDDRGNATLSLTVIEGKKRQIRLMLQAVGHPVVRLHRVRIGSLSIGRLSEGSWRDLTEEEVQRLGDLSQNHNHTRNRNGQPDHQHRRPGGLR